jgi:hypothetical protein
LRRRWFTTLLATPELVAVARRAASAAIAPIPPTPPLAPAPAMTTTLKFETTLRFELDYIEQAFARACVRESIRHGPENEPYLQLAVSRCARRASTPERQQTTDLDVSGFTSPGPPAHALHLHLPCNLCVCMKPALRSGRAPIRGRKRARTPRERLRLR